MKRYIVIYCVMMFMIGVVKSQSDIVIEFVLYDGLNLEQTLSIRDTLENNAVRIASHLNVEFTNNFRVHVWGDYESYLDAQIEIMGVSYPGSTGWIMGLNDLAIFFNASAPQTALHEFAHCISLHVNPYFGNNPRWYWESVAIYEANEFIDPNFISYMVVKEYPTINELNSNFNDGNYKIYEVGYLLSDYIIYRWGDSGYINLINGSGDIEDVFGLSVSEFEEGWHEFVENKYFGQSSILNQDNQGYSLIHSYNNKFLKLCFDNDLLMGGTLRIIDLNGKYIQLNSINGNPFFLDVNSIDPGIYIIQIQKEGLYNTKKIVIH